MKDKKEFIGLWHGCQDRLKPQYRCTEKEDDLVAVHIYLTPETKYGVTVELHDWAYAWDMAMCPRMSKEERAKEQRRHKRLDAIYKRRETKGLPTIDTSKWVKPDEESIRRRLVKALIVQELMLETDKEYFSEGAVAGTLSALLRGHAPKNPQSINVDVVYLNEPLARVLHVLKHPLAYEESKIYKKWNGKKFNHNKYLYEITAYNHKLRKAIIKPIYKTTKKMAERRRKMFSDTPRLTEREKKKYLKESKERNKDVEKHRKNIESIKQKAEDNHSFVPFWKRKK